MFKNDRLALYKETKPADAEILLKPIMKNGELITELVDLNDIQRFYTENIKKLPDGYKSLETSLPFELKISPNLHELTQVLKKKHSQN